MDRDKLSSAIDKSLQRHVNGIQLNASELSRVTKDIMAAIEEKEVVAPKAEVLTPASDRDKWGNRIVTAV